MEFIVPEAPPPPVAARYQTVRDALEQEPMFFGALMAALGSDDGREIVRELDELRGQGLLTRLERGEYALDTDGGS
jgi:hypothetical protein